MARWSVADSAGSTAGPAARVALVTGASRGIGAAIASALARDGVLVVGPHRDPRKAKRAERLRAAVEASGGVLLCPLFDITRDDQRRQLVDLVRERFGRLDLLVHNAAGGLEPGADERSARAINVEAKLALSDLALPLMPRGAMIVDVTSVLAVHYGEIDLPPVYELVARTKKEVERELRRRIPEFAQRGVVLGFVCGHVVEGTTTTALMRRLLPDTVAELARSASGGRPPTPADMAAAVVRLARRGCAQGEMEYVGGPDVGALRVRRPAAQRAPSQPEGPAEHPAHDAPDAAAGHCYSYERFASEPFCRDVDRQLLAKAPRVGRSVDLGAGTGAVIEHLIDLGKLQPGFRAVGVDLDRGGLTIAAAKFRQQRAGRVAFVQAAVERLPLADECCELVTFCNAVHLTDAPHALREAHRVMAPRGTLLVNTAYERTQAYPGNSARYWGTLVSLARRALQARHGYADLPRPVDLMTRGQAEFRELAQAAGFCEIEIETCSAQLDREAMKAICMYEEFARGSLPGVPIELATRVLVEAVEAVFERFRLTAVPRNWMFLTARKP